MNIHNLPIFDVINDINLALKKGCNIILQAEPGAGKSTVVPLEILKDNHLDRQKIIMLQPRRVAAKSIAHYLAKSLGEEVGNTVGYRVRGESKINANTRLEIVTEGVLTQIIQNDPELSGIGLIIFDEFHERSLHADLSLMLAKEVQQSLRDDLMLFVMSATIDTALLEEYLDNTQTISVKGRAFPVNVGYLDAKQTRLDTVVLSAVRQLITQTAGDILVFLPGIKEINQCLEAAQQGLDLTTTNVLALHGSLPLQEQQRALKHSPDGQRNIIFSTNIAETSLTIPGVTGVVDSGLERALNYDPNSGISRLVTKKISLASAEQRKGRAGRVQQGECIRLWRESENTSLAHYHLAEILNADLTDMVVQLAKWGNAHFAEIDWITQPPKAHFDSAVNLLQALELFSASGTITNLGKEVSELGLPVRLAKMIATTDIAEHRNIACRLAALISERDVLFASDSADLMERYHLFDHSISEHKARGTKLNISAFKTALELERTLSKKVAKSRFSKSPLVFDSQLDQVSVIAALALLAFPERLAMQRASAMQRANNSARYQLANGKGVRLRDHDPLCKHPLLVVTNCDLREREGLIFSAMPIDLSTLKSVFESTLNIEKNNVFDSNSGRFFSEQTLNYQSIKLAVLDKGQADDDFIAHTLLEQIKTKGEALFNWTKACEAWLNRLVWLGSVDKEFSEFTRQAIFAKADEWLLPYIGQLTKLQDLKSVDLLPLMKTVLPWELSAEFDKRAPEFYNAPSGKQVKIDYNAVQGPKVSIILQEVFGELTSPKLAGNINLKFELLSPARRPIQITSDIGQFWHTSYVEVAKDMRAQYPKHRWPTEPLNETAGRSIKTKK